MLVTGKCKFNLPHKQYITWHLHELSIYALPCLSSLLALIIAFTVFVLSETPETPALIILKSVLCTILIPALTTPIVWFPYVRRTIISRNLKTYALCFLSVDPRFQTDAWIELACKINTIFHEKSIWKTANFFFNGPQCCSTFREQIIIPFLQRKLGTLTTDEKQDSLSAAVRCYQDAVDEFFEECRGKGMPQLLSKFEILPKYTHSSKLYFHRHYLCSGRFLVAIFLSILSCTFYGEHSKPIFVLFNINLFWHLILQLSFWVYFILICYASYCGRKYDIGVKSRIVFLAIVANVTQNSDITQSGKVATWDRIAKHVNQHYHDVGVWKDGDENFFDGQECLDFFEKQIGTSKESYYPELQQIVSHVIAGTSYD
ncbi:hypothetical protein BZL39_A02380 [Zygosaccharomyces parabailii]|nr:hypothetical protein BZL39_A02380 [Zygosaccharomyces parabailii]CDH12982.1 uncharacterized protein ZBAI_04768 [Zygosaccharomyces bailii ISA1307]